MSTAWWSAVHPLTSATFGSAIRAASSAVTCAPLPRFVSSISDILLNSTRAIAERETRERREQMERPIERPREGLERERAA